MKTQEIKDYLSSQDAQEENPDVADVLKKASGKWKRLKKYKSGGRIQREFENSATPGEVIVVDTNWDDSEISFLELKGATKTYYYQLSSDPDDIWEFYAFDSQGNIVQAEYLLTIGSQPTYVDDGPYAAQSALEPTHKSALGRDAVDEMEGTFTLAPGEAAKLEPELIKAGWQTGHW